MKKEHDTNQKALERMEKASNAIIRERDTIHTDLRRIESEQSGRINLISLVGRVAI